MTRVANPTRHITPTESPELLALLSGLSRFSTVEEIEEFEIPRTEDGFVMFIETYDDFASSVDELQVEIKDLEASLNDVVYQLYELTTRHVNT